MRDKIKTMAQVALMSAVLAVLSPLALPLGPVPFTLGILAVCLAGALLPPLPAVASLLVYLFLGMAGLPVFSGFQAGPQVLFGPTGGYLAGYFLLATALSVPARRTGRLVVQLAVGLGGLAACYLCAALWYMVLTGVSFAAACAVCALPFALPDALKLTVALLFARAVKQRLGKAAG